MKIKYKKRGDKAVLNNFRPITMLNSDFKILAKILANRLKDILPKLIETNQAYAVKGRDITDTINNVRDMISYTEAEKKSGYVISLDLEKAFDRVEHEFLFDILKKIGFGENFIKWIKVLYKGAMSKIKCNGFLTNAFKITRSIRQGCPLSPQLYSLVAEPLGIAIQRNIDIKGIKIGGNIEAQKIFQYADDTTLIVNDVDSISKAIETVQTYCKGSGAKVNV